MEEFEVQTEKVELPSKGLVYPKENPLSSGEIEMKYMTAKEEDILTNQNYISQGIVFDKLIQSLIVSKIDYNDILIGDKNALLVAARVLGYGSEYTFNYNDEEYTVDLSEIEPNPLDESLYSNSNEFSFTLPTSKVEVTYKLLTGVEEKKIDRELKGLRKIHKNNSPELSTRMKHIISSINGDPDVKVIREFVDKRLLARDSKSLRSHIRKTQPDVDLTFFPDESSNQVNIPIGIEFFWPELD